MALSERICVEHIKRWEESLAGGGMPYRARWPSRLFHHAPIENAVEILKSMQLASRRDLAGVNQVDAAAQDVIAAREDAHRFGRLYFRPRTPTQFHCEGIRKIEELYHGAHSPVLIMLVLDAKEVLTSKGVQFSDMNMQSPSADFGDTDEFFANIRFDRVYHDSAFGQGEKDAIIKARCAEVLVPSPFNISRALKHIYCRSTAERDYLLAELAHASDRLLPIVQTSDDLRVFHKEYAFAQYVRLQKDGLVFSLNARKDRRDIDVQIQVRDAQGNIVTRYGPINMKATPPSGGNWIINQNFLPGEYYIEILLDAQLAYRAKQIIGGTPF